MSTTMRYRFFNVEEKDFLVKPDKPSFDVWSPTSSVIGSIEWWDEWQKYVFAPMPDTVWSRGCLSDIQDAIAKVTKAAETAEGK